MGDENKIKPHNMIVAAIPKKSMVTPNIMAGRVNPTNNGLTQIGSSSTCSMLRRQSHFLGDIRSTENDTDTDNNGNRSLFWNLS